MNNLHEQFKNHVIYQTLTNKLGWIKNALLEDTYSDQQKESLLAYQQLLGIIKANLTSKNLPMVSKPILDNLNNAVSSLSDYVLLSINSYSSQYQNLMDAFKRIPAIEKKSELKESFNFLIEDFQNRQDKIEEKLNTEIDSFILKKENIETLISQEIKDFQLKQDEEFANWITEKNKLQSEIENLREQNNNLKSQIDNFQKEILQQKEVINKLIENFQEDYKDNTNNFEERFVDKVDEYNTKIGDLLSSQKKSADVVLGHIEKRKNEIEHLWGIIGKSATVGNASRTANAHKTFADTMMWWTIALMCIALLIIAIATWRLFKGEYTYMLFVWKVITSAIILAPAFYCANISKRQREREFQLRDFEIKTATLEPFMENMILNCEDISNDMLNKDKIKLELTKAFFESQYANHSKNDCILIPKELAKILNNFAKKCNFNINLGEDNNK